MVLLGKPEGKIQLGRSRRRWEDNIIMDIPGVEVRASIWFKIGKCDGVL